MVFEKAKTGIRRQESEVRRQESGEKIKDRHKGVRQEIIIGTNPRVRPHVGAQGRARKRTRARGAGAVPLG